MIKNNYFLTVKAEDRPGLLQLVTGIINRKTIPIISLTAAPTDVRHIVLITLEIEASEKALEPLLAKLQNIIEVYAVEALPARQTLSLRSALFRLDKQVLETPAEAAITKWGAHCINFTGDAVLLAVSGSDELIRRLYNDLDGPYLQGFSQSGPLADSRLITHNEEEQSSVIRLAA